MPDIGTAGGPIGLYEAPAEENSNALQTPLTPIPMVSVDGKLHIVQPESYAMAIKNGWRDASDQEKDKESRIVAAESEKEQHPWKEAANQFANEATMGVKPIIEEHNRTDEENEIEREAEDRYIAAHPVRSYAAKGAGFAAPLLIPGVGEVGEAVGAGIREGAELGISKGLAGILAEHAEAGLGRKIAANAAKYATEGAIYSSPAAATQLAYGDPETAAETMAWGIGLSGILGVGTELLGVAAKGVGKLAVSGVDTLGGKLAETDASGMTHLDNIARNVLGISDKQAKELGAERLTRVVETADREGILSADPDKRPKMIKDLLKDSGEKIGEHMDLLDEKLDLPDYQGMGPKPSAAVAEFSKEIQEKFPELLSDLHSDSLAFAKKLMDEMGTDGPEPTFKEMWRTKLNIDKTVQKFEANTVKGRLVRLADKVIKKQLEESATTIYSAGLQPEKYADYLAQKQRYSSARNLSENLNPFKGTGKISNLLGMLGMHSGVGVGLGAAAFGHPMGVPYAAGNLVLKSFLKNKYGLLGKSVSYLRGVMDNPEINKQIGGFMAKAGMEALQAHMDRIPYLLKPGTAKVGGAIVSDAGRHVLGETYGLSKEQQYKKMIDMIHRSAIDAQLTNDKIGHISSAFTGTNIGLAALVAQKQYGILQYLQSQVPKNPNPPRAFQGKDDWKPTKQQMADFMQKVSISVNPMSIWEHYQNGDLTVVERDTLKAVYPKIYGEMVDKILSEAYNPKATPLPYDRRMQLSMFTGVPFDDSIKNLSAIQQAVAPPPTPAPAPQQMPSRRHRGNTNIGKGTNKMTEKWATQPQKNVYGVK